MKKIILDGYIGMDITSRQVSEALLSANGDDIEIRINTYGGSFNVARDVHMLFKSYPGKKRYLLGGTVASAGTYIVADENAEIIADAATAYMVHNASTFAEGDHRVMVKTADELRKATKNIADRLASMSGKDVEEVIDMMNAETWLYGQEIVDAGFAHELTGSFNPAGKNEAVARAKAEIIACLKGPARQEPVALPKSEPVKVPKEKPMEVKDAIDFLKGNLTPEELDKRFALPKTEPEEVKNALEENKSLKAQIVKDAESVRQAELTANFNADGPKNIVRKYADKVTIGLSGEALKNAITKIKTEDDVAKNLMAQMADVNSPVNTLETGSGESGNRSDGVLVC